MESIILVVAAFLPPLVYMIWIRNTERYHREPMGPILLCFCWGATIAVVAALILEVLLGISLAITITNPSTLALLAAIVVAPIAEELTKPLALKVKYIRKEIDELEDGFIYGAIAGLGFSATENLLYGWSFFQEGFLFFVILITLRSIGGCLLHASATAWTGYGISQRILKKLPAGTVIPYLLLAMVMHGLYNFFVSFELIGVAIGLLAAFGFVVISISIIRKRIMILDELSK